jgi:hypothetical protein
LTPEKWKELKDETSFNTRQMLYLYRAFVVYPWTVLGFFLLMCAAIFVGNWSSFDDTKETVAAFIFFVCFAPLFYFWGLRILLWILARAVGIPAEYLRK